MVIGAERQDPRQKSAKVVATADDDGLNRAVLIS
jgi:hypothetical protein